METYLIESGLDAFTIKGESVPYLIVYADSKEEAERKFWTIVDNVETNTINFIKEVDYYPKD